jgi:hypothetical protein
MSQNALREQTPPKQTVKKPLMNMLVTQARVKHVITVNARFAKKFYRTMKICVEPLPIRQTAVKVLIKYDAKRVKHAITVSVRFVSRFKHTAPAFA